MNRLKFMRLEKGLSLRQLGAKAGIHAPDLCKAEHGRLRLYPVQSERVASALGWQGDPMELFEEVIDDGTTVA